MSRDLRISAPGPARSSLVGLMGVLALLGGCGKEEAKPQARPPAQVST